MRHTQMAIVVLITLFSQMLLANTFEKNCLQCHFQPKQLEMFMGRYTMQYSSQKAIQKAIFNYLKYPSRKNSIMPMGFLTRFGVKTASQLSDNELEQAIKEYYIHYNIKQRIY